ncbi:MAG: DUF2804 domain-containing protein [Actinobacteria bacterium]|nr:DUF2804 domain-containing protein [Actinomycetota bacterium]MBU1943927.1 DUF2804 domain-containing protein [Actinomycetota bacterium]MBU2686452.1 DUF2804 domain-containing protein [Actinomycetota bacterium]
MELKETPDRMVEDGRINEFGAFRTPFRDVNISEARITTAGRTMPGFYSRFRLKEWQHFGFIAPEIYFGFAIVNAKFLANSFCYFLDRETGAMVEHDRLAPPYVAKVARDIWRGECGFRFSGYDIRIENRLDEKRHTATVDIAARGDRPAIKAEVEVIEDLDRVQPLELISILRGDRPAYTHKVACPAAGKVTVGGKTHEFGESEGIAIIDVQKTFFPYTSFWHWATFGGHDPDGRLVALNTSRGINIRTDEFHDNVLWVDGRMSFLGMPGFTFDESNVLDPWHIDAPDSFRLEFQPLGERCGKVNVGIIMSDFHQPFGTFRGTATDSAGTVHEIDDYFGVVEFHRARY